MISSKNNFENGIQKLSQNAGSREQFLIQMINNNVSLDNRKLSKKTSFSRQRKGRANSITAISLGNHLVLGCVTALCLI